MTSVSIVVPTFRRPQILRSTLESLLALDYPAGYELIIVDDGDDDATAQVIDDLAGSVRPTLLRQRQRGAASARNAGANASSGDLLLFCDDDMILKPDHLTLHVETHDAYPNAVVGGNNWYTPRAQEALEATPFGRYRLQLERDFRAQLREVPLNGDCAEASVLAACDLSISRHAFKELGGFDEAFPHAGAEDQDLSMRARRAGLLLVRNNAIRLGHNDDFVSLAGVCWREERGAETVVVLGRRFPEAAGAYRENEPIAKGDSPKLVLKKAVKAAFNNRLGLATLHWLAALLERLPVPESVLWRVYRYIIGVHIQRGYRRALAVRS